MNRALRPFDALLTPLRKTLDTTLGPFTHFARRRWWRKAVMLEAFIDAPSCHGALTVFPVIAPYGPVLTYLLSTEIQDTGVLTVRERGDAAPPTLLARNNSLRSLLVVGGEPLPGGDPGTVVEHSFILGGKSVTQIPASSAERGGWVSPDQEAIITEQVNRFPLVDHQVGILACLEDRILGLETFGSANLYRPLHRRLLIRFIKSGLSSADTPQGGLATLEAAAQKLVTAIEEADRTQARRFGVGEYSVLSGTVSGGELIHNGQLIHLSASPAPVAATAAAESEG